MGVVVVVVVVSYYVDGTLYVLASVRLPSLHGHDACVVFWVHEALRGNCRQNVRKTFLQLVFFCLVAGKFLGQGSLAFLE